MALSKNKKRIRYYHRQRWTAQAQATWDLLAQESFGPRTRPLLAGWTIEETQDIRAIYDPAVIDELAASITAEIDAAILKNLSNS